MLCFLPVPLLLHLATSLLKHSIIETCLSLFFYIKTYSNFSAICRFLGVLGKNKMLCSVYFLFAKLKFSLLSSLVLFPSEFGRILPKLKPIRCGKYLLVILVLKTQPTAHFIQACSFYKAYSGH